MGRASGEGQWIVSASSTRQNDRTARFLLDRVIQRLGRQRLQRIHLARVAVGRREWRSRNQPRIIIPSPLSQGIPGLALEASTPT